MKKILLLFIVSISLIFPNNIYADTIFEEMQNDAYVLIDMESGQILLEKNSSLKVPVEGITNIITGIIAVEDLDLTEEIKASENVSKVKGTKVYIQEDEKFLASDLLKASLVYSANDATLAIAEEISGSDEKFVDKMNAKVKELGCLNTVFTNSYGLKDSRHVSTAYDLALMAKYAIKNDTFKEYSKITSFRWQGISWQEELLNRNKLLGEYDGINGIMAGTKGNQEFLDLVVSYENNNNRYAVVILNGREDSIFLDAKNIIEYAKENFEKQNIVNENDILFTIKIDDETSLNGICSRGKSISIQGSQTEEFEKEIIVFDLKGSVDADQKIGELVISSGGEEIDRIDILAQKEMSFGINYFNILIYGLAVLYLIQIGYRLSKIRRKRTRK